VKATHYKQLILLGFFSYILPLHAQETLYHANKPATVHGAGSNSCSEFLNIAKDQKSSQFRTQTEWVMGFVSGADMWNPYDTKPFKAADLNTWLLDYCQKNMAKTLRDASWDYYTSIGGRFPRTSDASIWQHPTGYVRRE
jgi:hypothetical protein